MKILFVSGRQRTGTIERIPNLIRILSKRHSVVTLQLDTSPKPKRRFKIGGRLAEFLRALFLNSNSFRDIALVFASQNRYAILGRIVAGKLKRPFIFDSHGNPQALCKDINAGYLFRLRNVLPEKFLVGRVKRLITVSPIDKEAYVNMGFDDASVEVIPTCVNFDDVKKIDRADARNVLKLPADEKVVLFFGSFDYPPNREAAGFINDKLAPSLTETRIILAGSGELKGPIHPNIDFRGFVDELGPYISAADVCIAPVWHGVGILEKVLQMMAYGKATIVTPFAKRGIPELEDGLNCVIASDKNDFVEKTKGLLANPAKGDVYGLRAQDLIMKKYNWSLFEERLFHVIER